MIELIKEFEEKHKAMVEAYKKFPNEISFDSDESFSGIIHVNAISDIDNGIEFTAQEIFEFDDCTAILGTNWGCSHEPVTALYVIEKAK